MTMFEWRYVASDAKGRPLMLEGDFPILPERPEPLTARIGAAPLQHVAAGIALLDLTAERVGQGRFPSSSVLQ